MCCVHPVFSVDTVTHWRKKMYFHERANMYRTCQPDIQFQHYSADHNIIIRT